MQKQYSDYEQARPTQPQRVPNIQPQGPPTADPMKPPDAPKVGDQAAGLADPAKAAGFAGERKDESTFGGDSYQKDWDPGWEKRLKKSGLFKDKDLTEGALYDPQHRAWLNKQMRKNKKNATGAAGTEVPGEEVEETTEEVEETPEEGTGVTPEPMEQGGYEQTSTIGAQLSGMFPTRGGFESNEAIETTQGEVPESWQGTSQGPVSPATSPASREGSATGGAFGGIMGGQGTPASTGTETRTTGAEKPDLSGSSIEGPIDPVTGEPEMAATEPVLGREPVPNAREMPSFYQPVVYTGGM